jgi:hypothetical protein
MSEGLFAPLAWSLYSCWRNYHCIALILGTVRRTFNCVSLQVLDGNPALEALKALESEKNNVFSIYDIDWVCFFHCEALVAVLHDCTVGTTWQLLSLHQDAQCLRRTNDM